MSRANDGGGTLRMADADGRVEFAGPAGRMEALLMAPRDAEPSGIAVVCHPHPLHGGTMNNKVVHILAACARDVGFTALRFNFRGVGVSEGQYDRAQGEADDALAAVAWLRDRFPGRPLLLAGFSFGAHVALKVAARTDAAVLITVGTPPGAYLGCEDPARPACPWLAIHGREDDVVDFAQSWAWLGRFQPPPQRVVIDGTGHFFHRHLGDLRDHVLPFLRAHAQPAAAGSA